VTKNVGENRHARQPIDDPQASYLMRLVCRLGGCGPAVVMRTGPHLGGGPAPLGPAPTLPVIAPAGASSATASARRGFFLPSCGPLKACWPLGGSECGRICRIHYLLPQTLPANATIRAGDGRLLAADVDELECRSPGERCLRALSTTGSHDGRCAVGRSVSSISENSIGGDWLRLR
jgi:hypothetical protein